MSTCARRGLPVYAQGRHCRGRQFERVDSPFGHTDVGNTRSPRGWTKIGCLCGPSLPATRAEIVTAPSSPQANGCTRGHRQGAYLDRAPAQAPAHEDGCNWASHARSRAGKPHVADRLPAARLDAYLGECRYPRLEALLADIALGNRMPAQVARALARQPSTTPDLLDVVRTLSPGHRTLDDSILITGNERGVISYANCCLPPRRESMGYTAPQFHRRDRGLHHVPDYRKSPSAGRDRRDREVSGAISTGVAEAMWRTAPLFWRRWPRRSRSASKRRSNTWTRQTTTAPHPFPIEIRTEAPGRGDPPTRRLTVCTASSALCVAPFAQCPWPGPSEDGALNPSDPCLRSHVRPSIHTTTHRRHRPYRKPPAGRHRLLSGRRRWICDRLLGEGYMSSGARAFETSSRGEAGAFHSMTSAHGPVLATWTIRAVNAVMTDTVSQLIRTFRRSRGVIALGASFEVMHHGEP